MHETLPKTYPQKGMKEAERKQQGDITTKIQLHTYTENPKQNRNLAKHKRGEWTAEPQREQALWF